MRISAQPECQQTNGEVSVNSPPLIVSIILTVTLLFPSLVASAKTPQENTIATVTQRGSFLYIINAKGTQLSVIAAGDGLVGYTQSSVNVRRGNFVYVFDARGKQTSVIPAGTK